MSINGIDISFDNDKLVLYSHIHVHAGYILTQWITDAGRLLYQNICTSHFIVRFEKGYSRFTCERELVTEQKLQYSDPPLLWPSTLCLSRSPGLPNRRPRGSLCWIMASFTASYQQLLWSPNSIGVPEGPLGRVWLSLSHLVYNSVRSPWNSNSTVLTSVLNELYNSSTSTWPPTRSLKSHV